VPEIQDLRVGVKTLSSFGEFSTVGFTMIGSRAPGSRAGVVDGSYFEVVRPSIPSLAVSSARKMTALKPMASSS